MTITSTRASSHGSRNRSRNERRVETLSLNRVSSSWSRSMPRSTMRSWTIFRFPPSSVRESELNRIRRPVRRASTRKTRNMTRNRRSLAPRAARTGPAPCRVGDRRLRDAAAAGRRPKLDVQRQRAGPGIDAAAWPRSSMPSIANTALAADGRSTRRPTTATAARSACDPGPTTSRQRPGCSGTWPGPCMTLKRRTMSSPSRSQPAGAASGPDPPSRCSRRCPGRQSCRRTGSGRGAGSGAT